MSASSTTERMNVKFVPIEKSHSESFRKIFTGYKEGLVKSVPGGLVMTPNFAENADKIYGIKPKNDDVWLLTFPKTGNIFI